MLDIFREGGMGTIPTALFGVLLIAAAVRYAMNPERRHVALQVSLAAATLACGGLGFVTGVRKSIEAASQAKLDDRWIVAIGVSESLQNLVLAFVLVALGAIAASVGAARVARSAA
jgi:hypothetical protein